MIETQTKCEVQAGSYAVIPLERDPAYGATYAAPQPILSWPAISLGLVDCREGMADLPSSSVDVIVTSPPYNIGIGYSTHKDDLPESEYIAWLESVLYRCKRILKPEGSLFLNLGGKPSDPLFAQRVAVQATNVFQCQNIFSWVKSLAIGDEPVMGHQKHINGPLYVNGGWEYIYHLTPEGKTPLEKKAAGVGVPYKDKSNLKRGTRGKDGDIRDRGNVWFLPYETICHRDTDRPHPATYPASLPERCLRIHGLERAGLVVDPFMGIGTTARACARLGVPCVGYEIDPVYHAWSVQAVERELAG